MVELIQDRRSANKSLGNALLSNLLDENDSDPSEQPLTEDEIVGNIFVFLLAGHETTAHTLSFTFGLLALHQDEQEKLYREIRKVLPSDTVPTYGQMPLLTYSLAVFYETLRLFPPVEGIRKMAAEDTTLVVGNSRGEKLTIPVPKGTDIAICTPGLHYNPRYWEDPLAFKPARFLGDWNKGAFLTFSAGSRACIGRKFFETEGIAILTMLVSRYKIEVKEEPQFAGESFAERKARVLAVQPGITTTPVRVPLVFKRRE